jgi:hypothetical protein
MLKPSIQDKQEEKKEGHEDFCYCDACIEARVEEFVGKQLALEKEEEKSK